MKALFIFVSLSVAEIHFVGEKHKGPLDNSFSSRKLLIIWNSQINKWNCFLLINCFSAEVEAFLKSGVTPGGCFKLKPPYNALKEAFNPSGSFMMHTVYDTAGDWICKLGKRIKLINYQSQGWCNNFELAELDEGLKPDPSSAELTTTDRKTV